MIKLKKCSNSIKRLYIYSIQQEINFFVKAFDNVFLNYISTLKYCYSDEIYK